MRIAVDSYAKELMTSDDPVAFHAVFGDGPRAEFDIDKLTDSEVGAIYDEYIRTDLDEDEGENRDGSGI
jgi:hypothetical protein